MDGALTAADLAPDLERWRADTPGCSGVIHLNNAGAALALSEHLRLEQELGGYEAAESQAGALRSSYEALAGVLGCGARNIALVQNSTVAFAQALSAFDLQAGDVVLTSRSDYASNQIM